MSHIQASFLTMVIPYDDSNNQLLLINRPVDRGYPGYLGAGGKVELHESFSEAAVRELREETGLIAKPEHLIFKGIDEYVVEADAYRYIVFNYLIEEWCGSLLLDPPEGELHWVNRDDLDELPMQPWFRKRLPHFFQEGTFEISSISRSGKREEALRKVRTMSNEAGTQSVHSKG